MDDAEFSAVIPTSGSAGTGLFFKENDDDVTITINIDQPLANSDSRFHMLRSRLFFDSDDYFEYVFVNLTVIADCSIETVTPSVIA